MLFLFVFFFFNFTSKPYLNALLAGCYWCFYYCYYFFLLFYYYLDSSNKFKNCIFSLFFEEIYILSLPIIDEFLWSVVVSTVSPVTQYAEDELKNRHKAGKSRENT